MGGPAPERVAKRRVEGLCVQIMHVGPYSTEPETVAKLRVFAAENGLVERHERVKTGGGFAPYDHHEI